jgi:hypothetical protein
LKEKGQGGAVRWGKEKKWQAALLQIDVEKDRRVWLLKLERSRSQDLLVTVGKKRKFERGDCWWGIAAGYGLGRIRKLAALICFGLREKDGCWLLCILRGRERSSPSGLPRVEERNNGGRDRSAEKQLAASMNREQAEREEWWRLAGAPSCTCSCS